MFITSRARRKSDIWPATTPIDMKANMGTADRIIRVMLAIVMAVLYFTDTVGGTLGLVLLILAAVFLLTSFMRFCPLYLPFGISTTKAK